MTSRPPRATIDRAEVYVDGASLGNPGPSGAGIVFIGANGKPAKQLYKYLGETTNNVAEYLALLYALQEALRLGYKRLSVKTDSELLAKQIQGAYRVRDGQLRLFHDLARQVMQSFEQVTVEQIPRTENAAADRLAAEAIESRFDTSLKTAREVL